MTAQSQPFSDPQTVIPTPDTSWTLTGPYSDAAASKCPGCGTLCFMGDNLGVCAACVHVRNAPAVQDRMFGFPDVMRGQQCLSTDQEPSR